MEGVDWLNLNGPWQFRFDRHRRGVEEKWFEEPDESLKETNRSAYVYGLPDFSQYTMASSADQAKLLRQLLATIRMFEPLAPTRYLTVVAADERVIVFGWSAHRVFV